MFVLESVSSRAHAKHLKRNEHQPKANAAIYFSSSFNETKTNCCCCRYKHKQRSLTEYRTLFHGPTPVAPFNKFSFVGIEIRVQSASHRYPLLIAGNSFERDEKNQNPIQNPEHTQKHTNLFEFYFSFFTPVLELLAFFLLFVYYFFHWRKNVLRSDEIKIDS